MCAYRDIKDEKKIRGEERRRERIIGSGGAYGSLGEITKHSPLKVDSELQILFYYFIFLKLSVESSN